MEGFVLLYHSTFLKSISPVSGRPYFLCLSASSLPSAGAQYGRGGSPPPEGASVQSLPSGHNRPRFCCPAREHRSPPCAKGGQHGRAMQGGLQSQANDSAGCCDRVREHRLAVPTRDREHRLGAAARRQSLSRRSPTAPFAQGRSGGRTAILSLPWLVVLAWAKRV